MDIEASAAAMFAAFHARFGRHRVWAAHPDHDTTEPGRDAFRAMAQAVDAVPVAHPLDVLAAETIEGASAAHQAVFGSPLPEAPAPAPLQTEDHAG